MKKLILKEKVNLKKYCNNNLIKIIHSAHTSKVSFTNESEKLDQLDCIFHNSIENIFFPDN